MPTTHRSMSPAWCDRSCHLCEHRCGVIRSQGQQGRCGADPIARVYRHRVEYGEEIALKPSHIVYLSGCNLRCAFCIAEENAFEPRLGQPLTAQLLAQIVAWGRQQGARNLQWAGGEPTIHVPTILDAMAGLPDPPPVVWKSNFYATTESFRLFRGFVDVYVADFKFGNDACAKRIAGVDRYFATVARNLHIAAEQGDLIVRHLLLPGHFDCCCRPIVDWMQSHLSTVKFSIRDGYLPCWKARHDAELARPLVRGLARRAADLADSLGLKTIC